jgi:hypothetical protein
MANQIVVLNTNTSPDGSFTVGGVFWLTAQSNAITPLPAFVSAVPFIDSTTINGIQSGTIVEQGFVSGQFPPGTDLATVQAALQALYTAAQAALTAGNPPVSGLQGTVFTGNAWTSTPYTFTMRSVSDFNSGNLQFAAQGVLGSVPTGTTGHIDMEVPATSLIDGVVFMSNGATFGDTASLQIVDVNGITGAPPGYVLGQYATNWIVGSDANGGNTVNLQTPYPAKIPGGLYLRIVYTSTAAAGGPPVGVAINYRLHKCLLAM